MPAPCSPRAGLTTTEPHLFQKIQRLLFVIGLYLCRDAQPGLAQQAMRRRLVIAAAHGDRCGQFAQGFTAHDAAAAKAQFEVAALGVEHLDIDTPLLGFANDDARVGVQALADVIAGEQRLIVRVLVLQCEYRYALEAELLVEANGLGVVMHHRQIDVGTAARLVMLGELAHQGLADAWYTGLRVYGQGPQAGAAFGISKCRLVIHARDDAENVTVAGVHRKQVGKQA